MDFNIMGVDPGSRTVGVTILTVRPSGNTTVDLKLDVVGVRTLTLYIDSSGLGIHDNIVDRTEKLARLIKGIYYVYKPSMVAIESSFVNLSRMGAVIPLTKAIHTIESTIVGIDKYAKIVTIPPGIIKKVFGSSQKGKDAVLIAIKKKKHLVELMEDVDKVTDHEIDSVAIAFTLLEYIKTTGGMVCIQCLEM